MDIVDFFNGGVLELPKERPSGDFEAFFDQMLTAFVAEVGLLTDHNPVSDGIRAAAPEIAQLCQHLRAATDAYLDGFPHGAYEQLQQGIALVRPHVDRLSSSPVMAGALQLLYRVRLRN